MQYQRKDAVQYALQWAMSRNPQYYHYDNIGGDCTNFVSQCLYAGIPQMNYGKPGWYYQNANQKSPSWTGVEFLYQFLVKNQGNGPSGKEVGREEIEIGDVIQLSFDGNIFGHTLFVTQLEGNEIFVCTHTIDAKNRNINTYVFQKIRFLHIT